MGVEIKDFWKDAGNEVVLYGTGPSLIHGADYEKTGLTQIALNNAFFVDWIKPRINAITCYDPIMGDKLIKINFFKENPDVIIITNDQDNVKVLRESANKIVITPRTLFRSFNLTIAQLIIMLDHSDRVLHLFGFDSIITGHYQPISDLVIPYLDKEWIQHYFDTSVRATHHFGQVERLERMKLMMKQFAGAIVVHGETEDKIFGARRNEIYG